MEAGDEAGAEAAQAALRGIWRGTAMDHYDEIPAVKAAFASIDAVATLEVVRPPLVPVGEDGAAAIRTAMAKLREAFDAIPTDSIQDLAKRPRRS